MRPVLSTTNCVPFHRFTVGDMDTIGCPFASWTGFWLTVSAIFPLNVAAEAGPKASKPRHSNDNRTLFIANCTSDEVIPHLGSRYGRRCHRCGIIRRYARRSVPFALSQRQFQGSGRLRAVMVPGKEIESDGAFNAIGVSVRRHSLR